MRHLVENIVVEYIVVECIVVEYIVVVGVVGVIVVALVDNIDIVVALEYFQHNEIEVVVSELLEFKFIFLISLSLVQLWWM